MLLNGGGFQLGLMPKSVTCYICGRGYGTKSISIHLKTCQKKWDIEQMKKPKKQRKPCPQPPKGFNEVINKKNINRKDLEQLNNEAFENYDQVVLERCQFCNRTFNPEAFVRHKKICTADKPMNPLKKNIVQKKQQQKIDKSKNVLQDSSKKNLEKNNRNFQVQEPEKTLQNSAQFFQDQEEVKENQDLQQCNKCNRNFFADRLAKHMKVCKGITQTKKAEKKIPEKKQQKKSNKDPKWKQQHKDFMETMKYMKKVAQAEKEGKSLKNLPPPPKSRNPDFLECPSCKRTFNPTAHERHIKTCASIVNKPKMLKRKNFGKNNRGYQLHLIIINAVIMRSQSHQTWKVLDDQSVVNCAPNFKLSIKSQKKKIDLTESQLPKTNKLHQKILKSNRKTKLNFPKEKNCAKNKNQQTNKKNFSKKNFNCVQNYLKMMMNLKQQNKQQIDKDVQNNQKVLLKNLIGKQLFKKIKQENLINKPQKKIERCSVNSNKVIISPQPRLSTKAGRKIYSLNPMLDKEDKENRYPINQKLQEMYFRQCQRKLDFGKFQKCLNQAYIKNANHFPTIQPDNIIHNANQFNKQFRGTNFSYVQQMNILNPFKKPKNKTSYRIGFYQQQNKFKHQQKLQCQFEKYKKQQNQNVTHNQSQIDQKNDLNFTFSNFPNY